MEIIIRRFRKTFENRKWYRLIFIGTFWRSPFERSDNLFYGI